jgi:Na+/citrate or Na+/malate symporter
MRNILRNKPIFYTLLGVGVFELIMAFLLGKNFVRSLLQLVIPIIIGIVLGIMVALSEIYLTQVATKGS